jgi:hypothetical protein
MALAPTDFYAYSRATGVPVPEDPEERAALAPEVLEFRRNQLKGPESEDVDPLSVGVGLGLAAAGAGAGAYGIRSLLKRRDLPKQEGKGGTKFVDLGAITKYDVDEVQRRQANVAPPPSKAPDLVDIQDIQEPSVTVQQNETVDSGAQQFLRRRVEEGQRNVTPVDEAVVTPQEERLYAPAGSLPPGRRSLREEKITQRLQSEQELLSQPVTREMPGTQTTFAPDMESGFSSPTKDIFSTYAQIDPEMVERNLQNVLNDPDATPAQKAGALRDAQLFRTASQGRVTGESVTALAEIGRKGQVPYAGLLEENIGGARGQMKEVLNPTYVEAMQNYWDRRSTELPHTMKDYAERKEAGLLNYQLPPEQQSATNNAQVFKGWDKQTSEALREIYESEVGDIPQYVTQYKEARGEMGRALRGEAADESAQGITSKTVTDRAYLPVYQPDVNPGLRRVGTKEDFTYAGFPSYNLSSLSEGQRGAPLRYKGPAGGNIIDTVPLAVNDVTQKEIAPGVMGQFSTTRTVMSPLQRVRVEMDPSTGKASPKLVNFQIRLDQEISPGVTLQEAAQGIKQSNRLDDGSYDYENINKQINNLLENTVGDVPIMKQVGFDKYDESRSQFINMLTGTSYETSERGFLTGIGRTPASGGQTQFQKLPYTGPQTRAKSAAAGEEARRTNVLEAQRILEQEVAPALQAQGYKPNQLKRALQKLSSTYLPSFNEAGVLQTAKPQTSSEETRLLGQPKPDVIESPKEGKGLRYGAYSRIEPGYGGAVSSQLRTLIKEGAQVSRQGDQVIYSLGDKSTAYPANRLVSTLKSENQDALSIAELTGTPLTSGGQVISGPTSSLEAADAARMAPRPPSQERASESGYYYDESGQRIKEPISTSSSSFSGLARLAAGPASDVLSGNYPQSQGYMNVKTSPVVQEQLDARNQLALAANLTPGGRMVRGSQELGQGMGTVPAGLGSMTESEVIQRYGTTGAQLEQFGNQLMAQAAYKRGQQPSSAVAQTSDPLQARNDAVARHMGNYISASSQRMEGPASVQGVKLKGVGQNALRPYQAPSEGMIQQLMRAARRR